MALPLIPYVRQSRSKEQMISLDDQLRDIKAWADREGVSLADPVIERGVSGSKSEKRSAPPGVSGIESKSHGKRGSSDGDGRP